MKLNKYDIILCKDKKLISKIIHYFTKDVYNHSELYLGNNTICDAMPNGVKLRFMDKSLGEFDAYRYVGTITHEQAQKIDEFIQKNLNSKYDFIALVLQALHIQVDIPKKFICIELVIKAFQYAGLPVADWKVGFKQITDSKYFEKVN